MKNLYIYAKNKKNFRKKIKLTTIIKEIWNFVVRLPKSNATEKKTAAAVSLIEKWTKRMSKIKEKQVKLMELKDTNEKSTEKTSPVLFTIQGIIDVNNILWN